ncbi:MAG: acyltransferase family protein [bacterium]
MHERLLDIARKTPATRDRYVDFLRAFSILIVVIGHWLSAVIIKDDYGVKVYNAVGMISGLWIITWFFQIMPLFFFVGGFSNARTLNTLMTKGKPLRIFYKKRAIRLLKPAIFFLFVWAILIILLFILLPNWKRYWIAIIATVGPLWFLVVYLFVTIISPFMLKLHKIYKILIPVFLFILTALVDIFRFRFDFSEIAWLNVAFVWLFVHQLGFFYEDNTLIKIKKWQKSFIALIGLLGLIILTNIGIYPKSMIGTGFEKISNMNPPTICIIMLALWLIGLAMLLREDINKWLNRPALWIIVILANRTIMTLYLWHLTAYLVTFLLLYPIGLGHHATDNILIWWLERPVWVVIPSIILLFFIKAFGRFEQSGIKRWEK